jgi:pyruvate ferredoxin oxidoreductase gamma subunit
MNSGVLPDPSGFFEIRFESIGGLGAHAAGQILARAAVLKMNFNGSHFSSYGSEKKGSPVRSYVRLGAADKPIRTSAPIDSPDAIVVFHSALMEQDITLAGMKNTGALIFNGVEGDIPKILESVPAGAKIIRIDATNIAIEELSRPNAVLLGTLTARRKSSGNAIPRRRIPMSAPSGGARRNSRSWKAWAKGRGICP